MDFDFRQLQKDKENIENAFTMFYEIRKLQEKYDFERTIDKMEESLDHFRDLEGSIQDAFKEQEKELREEYEKQMQKMKDDYEKQIKDLQK